MTLYRRSLVAVLWLLFFLIGFPAAAQNVSLISSPAQTTRDPDAMRIAVPVAAGADLGGEGQRGVTPTIGFQIWKRDELFIGAFFTVAAADGTVKENYGGFLLNPPLQGRSFYVSGNKLWPLERADGNAWLLAGVGGRLGTTSTQIEFIPDGGTAATRSGFGMVASVTLQLSTPSVDVTVGDSSNQFQLGFEVGPTWRLVGGDLGEDDAFRTQVLGTEQATFRGVEFTFFARVNSVQPFARFSSFNRPDGVPIRGFTGRQVVWGINVASSLFQGKSD